MDMQQMQNSNLGNPYGQNQQGFGYNNGYQNNWQGYSNVSTGTQYARPLPPQIPAVSQQPIPNMAPPKVVCFVQGDIEANICRVEPNQDVIMVDANDMNNIIIYTRRREMNGTLLPLSKYRLVLEDDQRKQESINMEQYVKSEDVLDLINEAVESAVEKRLSEISFKPSSEDKSKDRR